MGGMQDIQSYDILREEPIPHGEIEGWVYTTEQSYEHSLIVYTYNDGL